MSHQNSRSTNTVGSFYGQQPPKMVTKTNVKGQCQDRLTANQLKPELNQHATTYNEDYTNSVSGSGNKSQKNLKQKAAVNNNNTKNNNNNYGAQQAPSVHSQSTGNIRINQANEILNQQKVEQYSNDNASKANKVQGSANFSETGGSKKFDATTIYNPECVHQDVKNSYLSNPNIKCDNEAEYYETVRRLDVCGRCWTDQQKYCTAPFKLKEKAPAVSLYQKDYKKHPINRDGPEIKNDFYNTFNIEEPIDFNTTNRNDFKPKKIEPTEAFNHNKPPKASVPFAGRAGSKADYINWGNMPVHYEKAPNNISVIPELPLLAKTSYGDNFGNKFPYERARPVDRDLWKNKGKSPLSPGIPFLAQTTSQRAFKPFKVDPSQNQGKKQEFESTESYPDQYRTTYDQDYVSHGKWKCPARVFLDTHPHPRSKYLEA